MIYEQQIIPEEGGYKGYLLSNGEVVATTNHCKTLMEVSKQLQTLIKQKTNMKASVLPSKPHVYRNAPMTAPVNNVIVNPPKCCGRS